MTKKKNNSAIVTNGSDRDSRIVMVDCNKAKEYLALSAGNRAIDSVYVNQYKRDMLSGLWSSNNSSLGFDKNGNLVDGHHRLLGLIAAAETKPNISIKFVVVRNCDEFTYATADTGKIRTTAQSLQRKGIQNYCRASAAAIIFWKYHKGGVNKIYVNSKDFRPTMLEMEKIYSDFPGILEVNQNIGSLQKLSFAALIHALWFIFGRRDEDKRDQFFDQLLSDKNEVVDSAPWALKKRLVKAKINGEKLSRRTQFGLWIKAWNAFKMNKPIQLLKFDEKTSPVPEIL